MAGSIRVYTMTLFVVCAVLMTSCQGRYFEQGPSEMTSNLKDMAESTGEEEDGPPMPPQLQEREFLALETGLPFFSTMEDESDDASFSPEFNDEQGQYLSTSPMRKRGYRNRIYNLKRSNKLTRLIARLIAMKGGRNFGYRASPVRFAAGRR